MAEHKQPRLLGVGTRAPSVMRSVPPAQGRISLEPAMRNLERATAQLAQVQVSRATLTAEATGLRALADRLRRELQAKEQEATQLRQRLQRLEGKRSTVKEEIPRQELERQLAEANADVQQKTAELEACEVRLREYEQELQRCRQSSGPCAMPTGAQDPDVIFYRELFDAAWRTVETQIAGTGGVWAQQMEDEPSEEARRQRAFQLVLDENADIRDALVALVDFFQAARDDWPDDLADAIQTVLQHLAFATVEPVAPQRPQQTVDELRAEATARVNEILETSQRKGIRVLTPKCVRYGPRGGREYYNGKKWVRMSQSQLKQHDRGVLRGCWIDRGFCGKQGDPRFCSAPLPRPASAWRTCA